MDPQVDDGNETILSFFPLPHRKVSLEGMGMVERLRSLAKEGKGSSPFYHPDLISCLK
ncbi:hypothetical protein JOD24_001648 [Kroppenstedtia sanguinis]